MDAKVETFCRSICTDLVVSPEESEQLVHCFQSLNPPPDKLVWLRATAFRLGCEFLSDDHDKNVALSRAIDAIVHSLEFTCCVMRVVTLIFAHGLVRNEGTNQFSHNGPFFVSSAILFFEIFQDPNQMKETRNMTVTRLKSFARNCLMI
jgi:hypothetical protein